MRDDDYFKKKECKNILSGEALMNACDKAARSASFEPAWGGKALTRDAIIDYALEEFFKTVTKMHIPVQFSDVLEVLVCNDVVIQSIEGRRQSTFGSAEDSDCSILSMAVVMAHELFKNMGIDAETQELYIRLREAAVEFGYSDHLGTIPVFLTSILNRVGKSYGLKKKFTTVGPFRNKSNVAYKRIQERHPAILSVSKANYGFYSMHSMTVVGTAKVFIQHLNPLNKNQILMTESNFFAVYDNASEDLRYVSEESLGMFSFLTVLKP